MKIVSLDPSQRNLGIAIGTVNTDGILKVTDLLTVSTQPKPKSSKLSTSTWDIQQAKIQYDVLQQVTADADVVCIEVPYGSQDVKAAVGRGICLGLLATIKAPCIYVTPQANKKIVGNPKATKADMVLWASTQHPEAPWYKQRGRITTGNNEHVADALVTIYAAANQEDLSKYIKVSTHAN